MATNNAPAIPGAVMLDRVLAKIQAGLVENISWIDVAFGRAQKLVRMQEGKRIVTPNVYCGGWKGHGENDYIEVSPDSKIGNFAFFQIDDPQTVGQGVWTRTITSPFALIVWFDLRKVYPSPVNRNVEALKAEVLKLLSGQYGWHLPQGHLTVARICDQAENIYRGYTLSEIDNQFLMHPYGGFRIEGTLEYVEPCV